MGRGRRWAVAACAVGVACVGAESQAGLIIDDFTVGPVVLTDTTGASGPSIESVVQTGLDTSAVAAGGRYIQFNAIDPFPFGDIGSVTVEVDASSQGVLRHSPDLGLTAANFFVRYGDRDSGLEAISLDLLAGGADRIVIDFAFASDLTGSFGGMLGFDFVLTSESAFFRAFPRFNTSAMAFRVELLFADILASSPGLDLQAIDLIELGSSNGTLGGNFEITAIRTTPEPGAASIALAMAGMTVTRRQRSA
ncbi:MAG: hypothetical protein AAGA57_00845 [Planctomycetota bacterium]